MEMYDIYNAVKKKKVGEKHDLHPESTYIVLLLLLLCSSTGRSTRGLTPKC